MSDDLKKIKELLEIVKHKVDMVELSNRGHSATLQLIKDQQSVVNEKLDNVTEDLKDVKDTQQKQVLPSVVTIETTIKAYGDMYKINDSNVRKVEKRSEFVLADVS